MKAKKNKQADQTAGEAKENAGQMLGDQQMELKGKMQAMRGEIRAAGEDFKEKAAEKANDMIDEARKARNRSNQYE